MNENPAYYNLITLASDAAPVVHFGEVPCSPSTPCLPASGSLLGSAVRGLNLPLLPTGGDPRAGFEQYFPTNFRPPYVQTYTLALEHQLGAAAVGEMRYVGSKSTHDFSRSFNPIWNCSRSIPRINVSRHRFVGTLLQMGSAVQTVISIMLLS